jgi:cytochrome c
MDFLDNFVLPQSFEHTELLHYMLIVILFIFIPFAGILLGGSLLSLANFNKFRKLNDDRYFLLAKDIIRFVTFNKSASIIFALVPIAAIIIIYAQLLHTADISLSRYFIWSLILVSSGIMFIFIYRSFITVNVQSFRTSLAASAGIFFLAVGFWLLVAGLTIPTLYHNWSPSDFFAGLFLWQVIFRFIFFVLFAVALAGGFILFNLFEIKSKNDDIPAAYKNFARDRIVAVTLYSTILIPVIILVNLFALPSTSLSVSIFVYMIVSLVLIFLGYHFLYLLTKEIKGTIAALLFLTLVFSLAANIIGAQKALKNETKVQSAVLNAGFEKYISELRGENKAPEINAAEIYQVKCASCHKWEEKLVGPPHLEVLPKYVGKEQQLIAFIRNPVKVNPEYPPMPNPGLKPNEAEAVAKYLIETYDSKNK